MRLFCTSPHGDDDPTVKALKDEVAYLRAQLAAVEARAESAILAEQARTQHYRDAFEHLVDARAKVQLEFLRRDMAHIRKEADAPPAPVSAPGETDPPWITGNLAAGGHLEEPDFRVPENYGRTEEELTEATIEQEAQRREEERLAAAAR